MKIGCRAQQDQISEHPFRNGALKSIGNLPGDPGAIDYREGIWIQLIAKAMADSFTP